MKGYAVFAVLREFNGLSRKTAHKPNETEPKSTETGRDRTEIEPERRQT